MRKAVSKRALPAIDDSLALFDWAGFRGPVVMTVERVRPLIDADKPAWICIEFVDASPDCRLAADLTAAINAADCTIITRNLDEIDITVGRLAAAGLKVLVVERPQGVPSPAAMAKALM